MENKNNSIMIVVLTLIIVGLGSFIVYDKFVANKSDGVQLSKNDSLVNQLLSLIFVDSYDGIGSTSVDKYLGTAYTFVEDKLFRAEGVTTVNDLSNQEKLALSYYNLKNKGRIAETMIICSEFSSLKFDSKTMENDDTLSDIKRACNDNQDMDVIDLWTTFNVTKSQLDDSAKELFGSNVSLNHEYFFAPLSATECPISSSKNDYWCHTMIMGGDSYQAIAIVFNDALKKEDSVEIEVKYISCGLDSSEKRACKKSTDENDTITFDQTSKSSEDEILGFAESSGGLYKLVFKKNSDNTYYWYSIQPVN